MRAHGGFPTLSRRNFISRRDFSSGFRVGISVRDFVSELKSSKSALLGFHMFVLIVCAGAMFCNKVSVSYVALFCFPWPCRIAIVMAAFILHNNNVFIEKWIQQWSNGCEMEAFLAGGVHNTVEYCNDGMMMS